MSSADRRYRIFRGDFDWPPLGLILFTDFQADGVPDFDTSCAARNVMLTPAKDLTPNQSRIVLRDGLIHLARRHGYRPGQIAKALGMPKSQVRKVLGRSPVPVALEGEISKDVFA